jgi:Fic family protein
MDLNKAAEDYTVDYKTLRHKYKPYYTEVLRRRIIALDNINELTAMDGNPLRYQRTTQINERLGSIEELLYDLNVADHDNSMTLIYEALSSCIIEGAETTIEDMVNILEGRQQVKTKSERMVYNTYQAMLTYEDAEINDEEGLLAVWRTIVDGVCENESVRGEKYRCGGVIVGDHVPPNCADIQMYMDSFFKYLQSGYMGTILKAIAVHYYLAYVHPFCDGNGRLSRFMLNNVLATNPEIKKLKHISLSIGVLETRSSYYKSLRLSETNNFDDFTYFILYYLEVIERQLRRASA